MSFSQEIKDDLCSREPAGRRVQELELATAILLNARFHVAELTLATSHEQFSQRLEEAFLDILDIETVQTRGKELYTLRTEGRENLEKIYGFMEDVFAFDTFHGRFAAEDGGKLSPEDQVHVLAAMYLAGGSVSDPSRAYHMELACRRLQVARFCLKLLSDHGLNGSLLKRYGYNVVYLKEGQQIADFLGLVGAHRSMLRFESLRVEKEMRNTVNRMVNCDTANAQRIADTAARQLDLLTWYKEYIGFSSLDDDLRAAARIRLENPALSLAELGELLDPPLGKSGMNHRLKKLEKLARQARGEQGE